MKKYIWRYFNENVVVVDNNNYNKEVNWRVEDERTRINVS
jgi:hypothetical protein